MLSLLLNLVVIAACLWVSKVIGSAYESRITLAKPGEYSNLRFKTRVAQVLVVVVLYGIFWLLFY